MADEIKEEINNSADVAQVPQEEAAKPEEVVEVVEAGSEVVQESPEITVSDEEIKVSEVNEENVKADTVSEEAQATDQGINEVVAPVSEIMAETTEPEELKEPKWYIIQTLTGQEEKVKERIENNIEALGLKEKVLRVLLPEEETVEIKGDKRIERKRKMYPGYVFVEMRLDEDAWYKIRSTNGVARFIGGKTTPQPVSEREIQRVLKQLGIKEKEIKVEFEMGEPIRIISGSFRGYTGSVSEVNAAKSKLKAMINIFGRDTSVEVDFDRVEKVV